MDAVPCTRVHLKATTAEPHPFPKHASIIIFINRKTMHVPGTNDKYDHLRDLHVI